VYGEFNGRIAWENCMGEFMGEFMGELSDSFGRRNATFLTAPRENVAVGKTHPELTALALLLALLAILLLVLALGVVLAGAGGGARWCWGECCRW